MLPFNDEYDVFCQYVTNNYDMFIDDAVFGVDFVTSAFKKLDMSDKPDSVCNKLYSDYGSINIRIDLEKEYSLLFKEDDYTQESGQMFKALFFYDIALRMYDVLGSFAGCDNPFFDESDNAALSSLIRSISYRLDIDDDVCLDYTSALGVATDFIENNKKSLIDGLLDNNDYTLAESFMVRTFYEDWISSFFSYRRIKMNILVDNIYIDEMRSELNGIATSKLGSEDEKVVTSLKMPMSCHAHDTGAYSFKPWYSRFNIGVRDIAILKLVDGNLDLIYE